MGPHATGGGKLFSVCLLCSLQLAIGKKKDALNRHTHTGGCGVNHVSSLGGFGAFPIPDRMPIDADKAEPECDISKSFVNTLQMGHIPVIRTRTVI